jgi:hypothetical protein
MKRFGSAVLIVGILTAAPLARADRIATNSSIIAVDCAKQVAYVARDKLSSGTGNGQVAVINLKVDPNNTDPRITTVDLGHADFPIGLAIDQADNLVVVVSGNNKHDGKLDLIREKGNTLVAGSPFAFPAGSDTGDVGQVVIDKKRHRAIVAMIKTGDDTSDPAGPNTGFAPFDLSTKSFGSIIQAASSDGFAFDSKSGIVISPADFTDPTIDAVNTLNGAGCTLTDSNLLGDADHAGFDTKTHLAVVGSDTNTGKPVVINLNRASFSGSSAPCTLDEAGTTPNSVAITTVMSRPAGIAINPVTHEAIVEGSDANGVGLLTLPKKAVVQLTSGMVTFVETTMPNGPDGIEFDFAGFPYTAEVDSCHNQGYGRDAGHDSFLARIDLNTLRTNAPAISTALPAGNCAGTSTTLACSNGNGVTFFPLP